MFGMGAIQPAITVDDKGILKAINPPLRQALFGGLIVGQGIKSDKRKYNN